jgi:hypothetical protein
LNDSDDQLHKRIPYWLPEANNHFNFASRCGQRNSIQSKQNSAKRERVEGLSVAGLKKELVSEVVNPQAPAALKGASETPTKKAPAWVG